MAIDASTFWTAILGATTVYAAARCIYLLYFHPLSKFPGPRIAAVSNIWYGYHWLSGRYPWAIEDVLRRYGDVVRIAPNELVFVTQQAFVDIYTPHHKSLEVFVKTDFNERGRDLGGIVWEEDPVRHREVARKLLPAFSARSLRSMEPLIHSYMDYFIERMKELGNSTNGVDFGDWTNWLALDLSADLTWNEKMYQMRDAKHSDVLEFFLGFNLFATVMQVFKRFPLVKPLQYLFVPFRKLAYFWASEKATRDAVQRRLERRGNTDHIDFFEYVVPADSPPLTNPRELVRLGSVVVQVMFAGFSPLGDWYYATFYCLFKEPDCYRLLVKEIRETFDSYEDITPSTTKSLPYLHACLEESLRLYPSNNTGLPRLSPGALVDGQYIPKGTHVQTSMFALARSSRNFHDPLHYRPQRWLPADHPLYNPVFANDDRKGFHPFSLGPRVCIGKEMAWTQAKMFMAKVLWSFDVLESPGLRVDLEKELLHYGLFVKPELRVRFVPRTKG